MTLLLIAALLAMLAIRVLQVSQVQSSLGATAVLVTALAVVTGHGAVLVAAATAMAAAVLGPVVLLRRWAVPVPARAWRAS